MAEQVILAHRIQLTVPDEQPEFAGPVHTPEGAQTDVFHLAAARCAPHFIAERQVLPRAFRRIDRAAFVQETFRIGGRAAVDRHKAVAGNRRHRLAQFFDDPLDGGIHLVIVFIVIIILACDQSGERFLAQLHE